MNNQTKTNFYAEWCDSDYGNPDNCVKALETAIGHGDVDEVKACMDWVIADVLDSVRLAIEEGAKNFEEAVRTAGEYYGNHYS